MLFHTFDYGVFLAVVFVAFHAAPTRSRPILLLVASYGFYAAWEPLFALLLFTSTLVDYVVALRLVPGGSGARARRVFLATSITVNLGLLAAFKYAEIFVGVGLSDFSAAGLLIPVGISFYTFQTLGYTLEVAAGRVEPERSFTRFALFVSFFPQLVAGPIENARDLLPQLRRPKAFEYERAADGVVRIAWGLAKKLVVADRLALYVDPVFADPAAQSGSALLVAAVLFTLQIYFDFSGYVDMAIGSARLFGVELTENFHQPLLSRSIPEFWRRWHVTLMRWFREHVYVPLGGNRRGRSRQLANLLVVFVLSGLWHGAGATFLLFGALHGGLVCLSILTVGGRDRVFRGVPEPLRRGWQIALTFGLLAFAFVMFRASNVTDAWFIWTHAWPDGGALAPAGVELRSLYWPVTLGAAAFVLCGETFAHGDPAPALRSLPTLLRWPAYHALVAVILLFGKFDGDAFLYLRF